MMPDELKPDPRLVHETIVLRECLCIALDALKFDRSPLTVQAVRAIAKRLEEAGIKQPRAA